jgi:hypothetical protein
LDEQNKYMTHLKRGKQQQTQENNMAERSWLRNQYDQETDKMIEKRMKSMEKQKQINHLNKYFEDLKSRHKSLNKCVESDDYKENPIEYRLRMDFIKKKQENQMRERDILEYNTNAMKIHKMKQMQKREKDKYYSKEFNDFVENQAVSHIINRTSQREKYETKRQERDIIVLKERTLTIKRTLDNLIDQYKELNQQDSTEMRELQDMQTTVKK